MKKIMIMLTGIMCLNLFAHDGGHGPALKDESIHGGKVTAIILKKDINKGRSANMIYKGELVFDSRKTDVQLYLYDKKMKPIDLESFSKTVKAILIERGGQNSFEFKIDQTGKFFEGKRPKNKRVPFNIDVYITKGKNNYFGAFDGLD